MRKLLILALILLVGCQSIWRPRIGVYTYSNALIEYGHPARTKELPNKVTISEWELPEKTLILVFGRTDLLISYRIKKTKANYPVPEKPNVVAPVEAETVFTIPDLALKMLWVKPGTFLMGSLSSEKNRDDDETRHTVTLTQGFWLGKYEVTQTQWEKVMGSNPSHFKGADRPVETVSWDDVTSFCEKLTEREREAGRLPAGMAYQLPTEAQWEYSCRAGTKTVYAFGDSLTSRHANVSGGPGETTDVGKSPANAWGFHDMHGNVLEWCADWYDDYPRSAVRDPVGAAGDPDRVHRGGSWSRSAVFARSAYRGGSLPTYGPYTLGFRLSLRPAGKAEPQPEPPPPPPLQPEPTLPLKPVSGPSPFTGRKKYVNHWAEGRKQAEWHLKDGKRDGLCKWWHRNGEMWKKFTYRLELLNGRYTEWYRTGVKKESFKYDKGKLIVARIWQPDGTICPITKIDEGGNGVLTEYSEDGKLFRKLIYKDGYLLPGKRIFLPENFEAISQDYESEMRKARESQMLRTLQEIENETNTRMIQMIKASVRKR
jgi:sulfatase modifying factor 1